MIKVKNLIKNGKSVANQYVIHDILNKVMYFQSYDTTICWIKIENGVKHLHICIDAYDHSATTSRHLNGFLDTYFSKVLKPKDYKYYISEFDFGFCCMTADDNHYIWIHKPIR